MNEFIIDDDIIGRDDYTIFNSGFDIDLLVEEFRAMMVERADDIKRVNDLYGHQFRFDPTELDI